MGKRKRRAEQTWTCPLFSLCQELTSKYTGRRPTNAYYRQVTELGAAVAEGGFPGMEGISGGEILMRYES